MLINNNIWKIFYIMVFGASILLFALLYSSFKNINDRYHSEINHYTQIISKTISADLLQKDMLLDIIGRQLLENENYKDAKKTNQLLDYLLKQDSNLIGFGLADINGNLLITSSNLKITKKINFLQNEVTKNSFKETLNSYGLVVGRSYYFNPVNEWIIPLRKAIRDTDGNILGVMSTGIKNTKKSHYLDTIKSSKNKQIRLVKDVDDKNKMYRLHYTNEKNISNEILYNTAVTNEILNTLNIKMKKKYNYYFDELRVNNETVTIQIKDIFGDDVIVGIKYDERFKVWTAVDTHSYEVWNEFSYTLFLYISLFLIVMIVFFLLFKYIATYEKRKKLELIFQTQHDSLTALPNRTYMYKNINDWISKHTNKYSVLYIDLDNFKNINDKFGHTIGDKILVEVAHRLRSFFVDDEMLVRQGGDEFIVLKEFMDEEGIEEYLQTLIDLISKVYHVQNKEFRVGMSVGIARYPKDASEIEELLSLADTAMYSAKKRKNSYCFFSEKLRHNSVLKADIEQELRGAIEKNELWMAYQPQINVDESLYGVEALIRWENKKLGFVGPDKFIAIAEETGLMKELGEFIITNSLREIKTIQSQLGIVFSLSINISVVQLIEADFVKSILRLIEDEKFDKSLLTLEITESLSIEDLDEVLPVLYEIKDNGIEISLDDFGTGYSSLSVLKMLPINELKIDKSFIDEMIYDQNGKTLVESIINIGKNFGMKTLAEGVENIEQVEELKATNCDIFQGYYFSKPLAKNELIQYLNKHL